MRPSLRTLPLRAALLFSAFALGGCNWLHDTFNDSTSSGSVDRVHAAVRQGMTMDEAEAHLSGLDFDCGPRQGNFVDEHGASRSAPRFLSCTSRPRTISFACENRDQVIVVPNNGVVDEVDVLRGPDCTPRPHPAPNQDLP